MKLNKKIATVMTLALTVSVAAACGNSGGNAGTASSPSAKAGESAKPAVAVKIETAQVSWGTNPPQDDFVKKELDRKLNINLTQTLVGDAKDYENQINVRAASNNLPDLFMANSKVHLQKLVESGSVLDLTSYIDKMPDYKKFAGPDVLKKGVVSGKQYAMPKAGQAIAYTYWIRKDWLDNLKLQPPTTVDELLEVAKAFTEKDPDGNGKKDTFGLTGSGLQAFEPIYGAYGVTATFETTQFFLKDNKLVNTIYEPGLKDALQTIKKFLDAGVVDPELISNKGTMAKDKAFQGKAGIINTEWAQIVKDDVVKVWKEANPKAEWVQLSPPKGPTGVQNSNSVNIGAASGLWVIPKRLESQPDKLSKILELMNYVSSQEGNLLMQFGLKDVHYKQESGKTVITEQGKKEAGFTWLYQFSGRPETEYLKTKFAGVAANIDFEAKLPRIQTLDGFIQSPQGYNSADTNRYIEEEMIKFVYGKRKIDEYDKFVQTLEGTFGYKNFLDSATKQLKDLGYGK
ncbi:MAG: hypothetical protein K0Q73_2306 [Paenibacillus sp.]|jgi:putative aldouronate transport system substrate-binding protein|nr:hypothetical protein [Paenibacillus sp.]